MDPTHSNDTGADRPRLVSDRYEVLRHVQASVGNDRIEVANAGKCRYCGCTDSARFRNRAHLIPEALGNRWLFALDECDGCNGTFSAYESALASSVAPLLTVGGGRGKSNRIRQTGRTRGRSVLRHSPPNTSRRISSFHRDHDGQGIFGVQRDGSFVMDIPVAGVPFRPRHAYKALTKIGMSLLPSEELGNYEQLRAWLLDRDDTVDFPVLEVAMSFAMVGNWPPLVSATLLRRTNPNDHVPHILCVVTAGSVCQQIDLLSDHKEDHIPCSPIGEVKIRWTSVLQGQDGADTMKLQYSEPFHMNWSASHTGPQPIDALRLRFCPKTRRGSFEPVYRDSQS